MPTSPSLWFPGKARPYSWQQSRGRERLGKGNFCDLQSWLYTGALVLVPWEAETLLQAPQVRVSATHALLEAFLQAPAVMM